MTEFGSRFTAGAALDYPLIGAADIRISDISPGDDETVWARITVDWGATLNWRARFLLST